MNNYSKLTKDELINLIEERNIRHSLNKPNEELSEEMLRTILKFADFINSKYGEE